FYSFKNEKLPTYSLAKNADRPPSSFNKERNSTTTIQLSVNSFPNYLYDNDTIPVPTEVPTEINETTTIPPIKNEEKLNYVIKDLKVTMKKITRKHLSVTIEPERDLKAFDPIEDDLLKYDLPTNYDEP